MEEQTSVQQSAQTLTPTNPPAESARILIEQPEYIQVQYATPLQRLSAALIDGIIVSVCTSAISFSSNLLTGGNREAQIVSGIFSGILSLAVSFGYYVYFTGKSGQTPGKSALHIKVVTTDGSVPGYGTAALRETIGKFISSIALSLGYFWMLWDEKKQTWHDKIANTIVVKEP